MDIVIVALVTLMVCIQYASVFEWTLHRYMMHRPVGWFRYPFEAHALTHHRIFGWRDTYLLQSSAEKQKIGMAWWNGPVLILVGTVPFALVAFVVAQFDIRAAYTIVGTSLVTFALYYGAYEFIHWCFHAPRGRLIERWGPFRWLDEHHRLHHRHMGRYNFNVVLPLADWCFGTLKRPAPN